MHRTLGYLRSKERISIVLLAMILTGFVGFLLVSNYRSTQKLRESTLRQYRHEIETRSRGLAHFLEARRQSVDNLADNGRLDIYFQNKALGMSLQYGLRSAVSALRSELDAFIALQKIDDQPLFQRIALLEADGNLIAHSGRVPSPAKGDPTPRRRFMGLAAGFYVVSAGGRDAPDLVYTRAFLFKNAVAGQIVAWLNTDLLGRHFLFSGRTAGYRGLLFERDRLISPAAGGLQPGSMFLASRAFEEKRAEWAAAGAVLHFRIPVAKTGFELAEIVSAGQVVGSTPPRTLLLAMALLFFGLVGTAAVLVRMVAHTIVLQTRVEESRKREQAIERKNDQLHREIEERKRSEAARSVLEARLQRIQKMEAIGMLAGGVAHDLNNILSGLVSYPELILMDLPAESPMRGAIETIQKSGRKAATIVQDLLTLARRGVATTTVLNLNEVVEEYLSSPEHGRLLEFHAGVRIVTGLRPDLLDVLGSSVHLSKTVMNLVTNAAESMPRGGRVRIDTENRYVDRPIRGYDRVEEGEYVLLQVSDEGIGISPEDRERIFEPFYTKKVMGRSGTGLGMAVVWSTVKDHSGYIDLESREGEGTRIALYFPVTRERRQPAAQATGIGDLMGAGQSILVVDDIEEQRRIACNMLEKLGYKVILSGTGEQAVAYLSRHRVNLVVLDMIMDPGIDGLETYRRLATLHPGQKAVIASGYSETERVREAQRLGAGPYLKKPYSIFELGKAVRETLSRAANAP